MPAKRENNTRNSKPSSIPTLASERDCCPPLHRAIIQGNSREAPHSRFRNGRSRLRTQLRRSEKKRSDLSEDDSLTSLVRRHIVNRTKLLLFHPMCYPRSTWIISTITRLNRKLKRACCTRHDGNGSTHIGSACWFGRKGSVFHFLVEQPPKYVSFHLFVTRLPVQLWLISCAITNARDLSPDCTRQPERGRQREREIRK